MADPQTDIFGGLDVDKIVRGAMPQTSVDIPKIKSEMTAIGQQEAAAKDRVADRNIGMLERDLGAVHRAEKGIEPVDLKPWNAEEERRKTATSPMEQFGSWGVLAATLASAFTRTPMVNALNGAAAAMTAIQERDDKKYQQNWDAAKQNAELAIKRHQMQREAYQDAMSLLNTDREAGAAELQMLAAKFGDARTRALLDGGYIKELIELQNSQQRAYQGLAQMLPQLEQMNVKKQAADYLRDQGQTPVDIYRSIYAPAYSTTLSPLKSQAIIEEMRKNGGDFEAAVRKVEASFNPQKVNLAANYAQEAITGLEKDGIQLDSTTKSLVASTLGKASTSGKAAEVNSAVAGAMEEIKRRKETGDQIDGNAAGQIIRDAIASATGGQSKIDRAIINQLPHYEGMTQKDLGYIGTKNQDRIMSSIQSAENIENIAEYAAANPEAIGLIADSAKRMNFDAYEGLFKDFSKMLPTMSPNGFKAFAEKTSDVQGQVIDAEAKQRGLSQDVAEKAKVLNKMLATQAFADAAQAGSRGATIYLDKAFREIYQQASSPPAFFDILRVREREADNNLSKYNLDLKRRNDLAEKFPFFSNPDAFFEKAVTPRQVPGTATTLPPTGKRVIGQTYPTPRGPLVWGGDAWYTAIEWQAKNTKVPTSQ